MMMRSRRSLLLRVVMATLLRLTESASIMSIKKRQAEAVGSQLPRLAVPAHRVLDQMEPKLQQESAAGWLSAIC